MENRELFESMPVSKALARLAVPTIVSQLITMVYNLADTFFIGSTKEPYKVAAATLAYTLFFILNALSNHFGIGGGSLISRLLGDGKPEEAKGICLSASTARRWRRCSQTSRPSSTSPSYTSG